MDKFKKYLALDLELNQPSNKIIQVGVAIGSATDDRKNYITKKWYINPNEPLNEFITGLTGITEDDINKYSVSHETMAQELIELIKEHDVYINPVTWGGGDSTELLSEIRERSIEFHYFGRRWIDVKTWYTLYMLCKGKKPAGGLSSAMGQYKLQFIGHAHRADVDAANTLALFFKILDRYSNIETILERTKSI